MSVCLGGGGDIAPREEGCTGEEGLFHTVPFAQEMVVGEGVTAEWR